MKPHIKGEKRKYFLKVNEMPPNLEKMKFVKNSIVINFKSYMAHPQIM